MNYNIITGNLNKKQSDKLYKYLVKLQKGIIPIVFEEANKETKQRINKILQPSFYIDE